MEQEMKGAEIMQGVPAWAARPEAGRDGRTALHEVVDIELDCPTAGRAMDDLMKRFDRLAAFGKELEITELDINTPDEATHANYASDSRAVPFAYAPASDYHAHVVIPTAERPAQRRGRATMMSQAR